MEKKPYVILAVNLLFLAGIFSFRVIGLINDFVLLALFAAITLEAILLALFSQVRIQKLSSKLKDVQSRVEQEEVLRTEKANRTLIYLGHQIKAMQLEFEAFKKNKVLKPSTIRHRIQA